MIFANFAIFLVLEKSQNSTNIGSKMFLEAECIICFFRKKILVNLLNYDFFCFFFFYLQLCPGPLVVVREKFVLSRKSEHFISKIFSCVSYTSNIEKNIQKPT